MAELGVNRREAVGMLQMLWEWASEYAPQGDIGRWSDAAIAAAVEWPVLDFQKCVDALINAGWLDRCKRHRLVIHDWEDHCEEYVRKRLSRKHLEFAKPSANGRQRQTTADNGSLPCPALPGPSPAKAKAPDSAATAIAWSQQTAWTGISSDDRAAWGEAYPACDIDLQLRRMTEWLRSNPAKAKKARWRRFITNWLSRSQDRGGDVKSNPAAAGGPNVFDEFHKELDRGEL